MTLREAPPREQLPTNAERERDHRAMALSPGLDPAGLDDPRWLLAERILATPDFRRSPRLADFLHYIVRATLQGRSTLLNEQHIGEVVFGREPDYDATADTIVRSHALRLRRRLEQYAARAGAHDDLRLTIPRGAYVPTFIPTAPSQANSPPGLLPTASSQPGPEILPEPPSAGLRVPGSLDLCDPLDALVRSRHRYRLAFLLTLLVAILCIVSALFLVHARHPASESPGSHHALWSQLFTQDQPTRIVLGDSGLVLFHAVTWQYVSLHDYLGEDFARQMASVQHVDPAFATFLRGRRYTSMVDAATLGHLLRLPEATPDRTLVQYARDMRLNDFKSGNLILLGAQEADPWVELFEKSMDFVFDSNTPDHHTAFLNRRPTPTEQSVYTSDGPGVRGKLYAVVAYLPNLSATGNVLLLEGSSMAGTESAVDLVMDDHRLLPMLDSIRKPDGTLPYFEMLLESDAVKDSAEPARVVSLHTHAF